LSEREGISSKLFGGERGIAAGDAYGRTRDLLIFGTQKGDPKEKVRRAALKPAYAVREARNPTSVESGDRSFLIPSILNPEGEGRLGKGERGRYCSDRTLWPGNRDTPVAEPPREGLIYVENSPIFERPVEE